MSAGDIVRSKGSIHIARLPQLVDDWVEETALAAGKEPYGDVHYADPGYQKDGKKRYPLDTEQHVRSAHSYFSKPSNYERYTPEQRAKIKARIHSAWVKLIDSKGPPSDNA